MHSHKVRQIELRVGRSHKQRTSLVKAGHMLAGEIVVGKQTAAVVVSLQCLAVEVAVQLVHIHLHAHHFRILLKQIHPRIQVGSTVVTVHHRHKAAIRGRHQINGVIDLGQFLLHNDHTEHARSRRYIAGTLCHAVGRRHACARITLGRTERNTCLQGAGRIKQLRALFCQRTRLLPRGVNCRKHILQFPCKALVRNRLVKLCDHLFIKLPRRNINREHTRRLAHADNFLTRQFPLDIARQRDDKFQIRHMRLAV